MIKKALKYYYFLIDFVLSTKESVFLLKLKKGSALLLKEILNKALYDDGLSDSYAQESRNSSIHKAREALKEIGIAHLACEKAYEILNLRTDFIDI